MGRRRPPRPAAPAVLLAGVVLLAAAGCGPLRAGDQGGSEGGDDVLAPVPTTAPAEVPGSGWGPPVVAGTLADPAVVESSGLAASRRTPGLWWTHNDSGDEPLLYCLQETGAACGVWRVTGATARDWEDLAAGPGPEAGRPYLYVGDIGDNLVDQASVTVWRVPEPEARRDGPFPGRADPAATAEAEALVLRYPDGPHNAEALAVHPGSGDLYVVAKGPGPGVYVARAPLRAGTVTTMEKVATLPLGQTPRTVATGADISPDGTRVAISTYVDGFELRLPAGAPSFDAVWREPPQRLTLGVRPQGEAIAYRLDGTALLTTTERPGGAPGLIHRIDFI